MSYQEVKILAIEYARTNCKPVAIYLEDGQFKYIESSKAFRLQVIEFISRNC